MATLPHHNAAAQVKAVGDTVVITGPDIDITLHRLSEPAVRAWAQRLFAPVRICIDVPPWLEEPNPDQVQSLKTPLLPREEFQSLLDRHQVLQASTELHQIATAQWFRQLRPYQQAAVIRRKIKRPRQREGFEFLFPYLSPEQLAVFIAEGAPLVDQDQETGA